MSFCLLPLTNCLLQGICCAIKTTCHLSSQKSSHVLSYQCAFSCHDDGNQYSLHTFASRNSFDFDHCDIYPSYGPDLYLKHCYKILAVLQSLPIQSHASSFPQVSYNCIILATIGLVRTSTPIGSTFTERVLPMCASQNCRQEDISHKGQNLSISNKILEAPAASAALTASTHGIVVKSQAEENWEGKNGKRRLRRLGCVVMGLVVITVVMFVF